MIAHEELEFLCETDEAFRSTLHVQPPHLYNVGTPLPFEKRFVAVPAEGVRFVEDIQRDQPIVQIQQSLRNSLGHFVKRLVRCVHLLAIGAGGKQFGII